MRLCGIQGGCGLLELGREESQFPGNERDAFRAVPEGVRGIFDAFGEPRRGVFEFDFCGLPDVEHAQERDTHVMVQEVLAGECGFDGFFG